mgnify:CR=1 FL=1
MLSSVLLSCHDTATPAPSGLHTDMSRYQGINICFAAYPYAQAMHQCLTVAYCVCALYVSVVSHVCSVWPTCHQVSSGNNMRHGLFQVHRHSLITYVPVILCHAFWMALQYTVLPSCMGWMKGCTVFSADELVELVAHAYQAIKLQTAIHCVHVL